MTTKKQPVRSNQPSRTNITGHLLLIVLSLVAVFPFYWMVVSSFRSPQDIYSLSLLPQRWTLENYRFVFETLPILRMLGNTLVMAGLHTVAQVFTGLLAAYAFSRWRFVGSNLLLVLFTLTWLVPFQVTMIPNYVLVSQLGWLNTMSALIVPQIASTFAVLFLYQSLKGFPDDLIDAARMDGATSWGVLWRVITPNLQSPLAALAVLTFIGGWNDYFWPLLVTNKTENTVIQIGLQMFLTQEGNHWGALMAAASLASLPVLIIYVVLQRQVIDSFVKSGLR